MERNNEVIEQPADNEIIDIEASFDADEAIFNTTPFSELPLAVQGELTVLAEFSY